MMHSNLMPDIPVWHFFVIKGWYPHYQNFTMAQNFMTAVKIPSNKGSRFDLTHDVKASYQFGKLYPTLVLDAVPGDKFKISNTSLLKFLPMVAPIMHRIKVETHYFFVPNRLLWPNWQQFITNGGDNPDAVLNNLPAVPFVNVDKSNPVPELLDHMGMPSPNPTDATVDEQISVFALAAYQKAYDDYYRDENLQERVLVPLLDGSNDAYYNTLTQIRTRSWMPDLFTKSLPFAQKGPGAALPLATSDDVPVRYNEDVATPGDFLRIEGTLNGGPATADVDTVYRPNPDLPSQQFYAQTSALEFDAVSINDLRTAFRLQEWLEKNARGGTRYTEILRAHFNVTSDDARLQRAEYIGGTSAPVTISETLSTAQTEDAPQSNMSGNGMAVTHGDNSYYFCKEHGYIIGIMSIMPETAYQNGIPKHFLKITSPLQYMWPEFAHIGEQPVLKKEIYAYTNEGPETFGYQPNYYEYRYIPNRVAGQMRTTLSYWHLGRIFDTMPELNADFIVCQPDAQRIFAAGATSDYIVGHILNRVSAYRLLPKYGTPTF